MSYNLPSSDRFQDLYHHNILIYKLTFDFWKRSLSNTYSCFLGYIGEFEIVDDHRSGKIVVQLIGRINKTGVISPRFNVKQKDIETWINNLLPSRQFGFLVLTTSAGIMDHEEARRKKTGGKILGFFY